MIKAIFLTTLLLFALSDSIRASFDVVYIENHSDSTVSVYKTPLSSRSRPVRNIGAGEVAAIKSNSSDQFVVTRPVWYRLVGSIRGSDRKNRLVIRNSDLRKLGTRALATKFHNRSGKPVKVRMVVDGNELDWMWIKHGRTVQTSSFAGQDWVVRDQGSGRMIQRATTPSGASTTNIEPPRTRGRDRDRDHDDHDHDVPVELSITNTTPHTIAIYKKTRFASRRVGTIATRKTAKIETAPGEVWRIEDTVTYEVLQTIVVPDNNPHCKVSINRPAVKPKPQSRPPAPRKVNIDFHNDTDRIIYIYKKKANSWKYTKRIYPNREYRLEFDIGQAISIRDPKSGKELESLSAPARDTTLHVEPHGDHTHAESGSAHFPESKPAKTTKPQSKSDPVRPRDILRRILGGK